ncbi:hypothetical protein [Jannaschia formosa]|uniref:hypothetical protein n=1 Tax=Jannaschia formosa TaxID=2259592 RepID=UPI001ADDBCF6|nr:hypothetical protein [Jannaschia formosa]
MPLPSRALSVRQPWAWAILHAGKDIENRSAFSIAAGGMTPGRIALHAASGMTRAEYDWAVWRMGRDGVAVPRPDALPRRAILGAVEVTGIVSASDSPWFGGRMGLVLRDPVPCEPIPAPGARGYFDWRPGGEIAPPLRWMRDWGQAEGGLFDDLPPAWPEPPARPFGTRPKADPPTGSCG